MTTLATGGHGRLYGVSIHALINEGRGTARIECNPRDVRGDAWFYARVGDDSGVFGGMSLLGCQEVCPKAISPQGQIAHPRRAMARHGSLTGAARR